MARGGHPVRGVEGGVLLEQHYGGGCRLQTHPARHTAFDALPFAATADTTVELEVTAMACPPTFELPMVRCAWDIEDTDLAGEASWQGWTGQVPIRIPGRSGIYALSLTCSLSGAGGESRDALARKLFVTLGTPLFGAAAPQRDWYQKACSWGAGFEPGSDPAAVLRQLLDAQFEHAQRHWSYGSWGRGKCARVVNSPARSGARCEPCGWCQCSWQDLVADNPLCNFGSCFTFSDVLDNLAAVLGIGGLLPVRYKGDFGNGFVTKSTLESADSNYVGNSRVDLGGPFEAGYLFSPHSLRGFDGRLYDATFDQVYEDFSDFTRCQIEDWDRCGARSRCREEGRRCFQQIAVEYGNWDFFQEEPATSPRRGPKPVKVLGATFERSHSQITAQVVVRVRRRADEPTFLRGILLDHEGRVVANTGFWRAEQLTAATLPGEPGRHTVPLHFSGEECRRHGRGPTRLKVLVFAGGRVVEEAILDGPHIHPQDFWELPAVIREILPGSLTPGGYRMQLDLGVRDLATTLLARARLAQGGQTVGYAAIDIEATALGVQSFAVEVPGTADAAAVGEGLYRLTVELLTAEFVALDGAVCELPTLDAPRCRPPPQ